MNTLFLEDSDNGLVKTWNDLQTDLNQTKLYNYYCYEKNCYEIFKCIILSLILNKEITLIDGGFSDYEIDKLLGTKDDIKRQECIDVNLNLEYTSKDAFLENIFQSTSKWKISLFTSGTTGKPKRVSHRFSTMTRYIKKEFRQNNAKWGLAYNPNHIAGVYVFFQALLNGNSIVRLFGLRKQLIYEKIKENKISHISATPTFYRMLLPFDQKIKSVKHLTVGGEIFYPNTIEKIKRIFTNAQILNIYASTEIGSLLASSDEYFTIPARYKNLLKIQENVLYVHSSLLGSFDNEKEEWYNTGDLIEYVDGEEERFKFATRITDVLNVGGYNVVPAEVESCILKFPGIKHARVYGKKNSVLGNLVAADLVVDGGFNKEDLMGFLKEHLLHYKLPRIINYMDELPKSYSGKMLRN